MVVIRGINVKSPVAFRPLKSPHPHPASSSMPQPVWKIVSPAPGKDEDFQTTRFIWDVTAPSPCPLPVPCLALPAPGRTPPRVCKAAQACLGEAAQSSQCCGYHVVVRRLGHLSGMQCQPKGLDLVSVLLGNPERHMGPGGSDSRGPGIRQAARGKRPFL